MPASCRFLEWDTDFFGIRTARVNESRVAAGDFAEILDWCTQEKIRCLYLLADAADGETGRSAEDNGFHLADIRVTLGAHLDELNPQRIEEAAAAESIRPTRESDIAALAEIARTSHTDSRFYFDPGFERDRCDALYGLWLEKSCRGDAQAVFVAERDGKPAGYITCNVNGDVGNIGLIGVAAWARGAGFGGMLVNRSLSYFRERDLRRVTVVTQGRNAAAQRLYGRSGFLMESIELWYHRWFAPGEGQ